MKRVKSRLFKKYLERRKSWAQFSLSLGWLHISDFFENWSSVGAGAQIIGKVDSFWHSFGPNFINIWRAEKRSIILKKVALSTFKET